MVRHDDGMVIVAFDRGIRVAKAGRLRSANPYMPSSERELWESWNCGFDEAEPRFAITAGTRRGET
jgi:hypothetical protein